MLDSSEDLHSNKQKEHSLVAEIHFDLRKKQHHSKQPQLQQQDRANKDLPGQHPHPRMIEELGASQKDQTHQWPQGHCYHFPGEVSSEFISC